MKTRPSARNWIGMASVIVLAALLATANVHAMDATAVYSIAPLAIECDVLLSEDVDPLMAVAEADVPCDNSIVPKMSRVEFTGNVAWVWTELDGESELIVYLKRGALWERIPYSSEPDQAYLDLLERENAFFEEQNPGLTIASPLSEVGDGSAAAPDASYLYAQQLERAAQEQANPAPAASISSNEVGDGSSGIDLTWLYMLERERAAQEEANPAPRAPDISIDRRGENYWNEILTDQEGAPVVTPSRARAPSDDTVDPIALAELEVGYDAGSDLNTLAELDMALFAERWAENAAGEDLSREDVVADIVVGSATDWAMASDPLAESYGFTWTGSPTAR